MEAENIKSVISISAPLVEQKKPINPLISLPFEGMIVVEVVIIVLPSSHRLELTEKLDKSF